MRTNQDRTGCGQAQTAMVQGMVVRAVGGFFFVHAEDRVIRSTVRGRLKRGPRILVGDRVQVLELEEGAGVVEQVLPRNNQLQRPPIANVDQAILVMSLVRPPINRSLLDRLLVLVQAADLHPTICLNKIDLVENDSAECIASVYRDLGFPVVLTSPFTGQGMEEFRQQLQHRISVVAGPSGAGKSSLVNALDAGYELETGSVSDRLGRGRHVTRQVQLLPLPTGGWVADTPGFTALCLHGINQTELMYFFPEMVDLAPLCRFNACRHGPEPQCAVKEAVERGRLDRSRYDNYIEFMKELEG